jgi:hypothetical protein
MSDIAEKLSTVHPHFNEKLNLTTNMLWVIVVNGEGKVWRFPKTQKKRRALRLSASLLHQFCKLDSQPAVARFIRIAPFFILH